jgi:hypothetical protein
MAMSPPVRSSASAAAPAPLGPRLLILTLVSAPATHPPRHGVAVPAAVGVVVAAVVAVLVVVGVVVSLTEDRLPTGPALPPPPAPVAEVTFRPATLQAEYAGLRARMPAHPYVCPRTPDSVAPLLTSGIVCSAPVHPDYEGTADWTATAGFGAVADDLVGATPAATAKSFFDTFREAGFGNRKTTLTGVQTDQADVSERQVALISGNVGYQVAGVPSRYDRVLVVVLPLDDGSFAAYFSSRPDDTPKATIATLNESINSLYFV